MTGQMHYFIWIRPITKQRSIDRFTPEDHKRLRECLGNIKGRFVLSYNDCQQIRDLYERYTIIEVDRMDNLVNKDRSQRYKELIIKTINALFVLMWAIVLMR